MTTRVVRVQVPATWTDEEVARLLGRSREPELTWGQAAKQARQVEVESELLAALARRVAQCEQIVAVLTETSATKEGLRQASEALGERVDYIGDLAQETAAGLVEEREERKAEAVSIEGEAARRLDAHVGKTEATFNRINGTLGGLASRQQACVRRIESLEADHGHGGALPDRAPAGVDP